MRRLAVAEDVIRHPHAGRDVVVAGHAVRTRQRPRRPAEHAVGQQTVQPLGEEAPRMLVAQRALQRQPVAGPLILHVERVVARAVGLLPFRDALRDLVGHAGVEAVLQPVRREVAEDVGHFVGALIADFHAVRAGHVGERRAPHVVRLVVVVQPGVAVVDHVGHGHAACQAPLLHRDERLVVERAGRRGRVPVAQELRGGSFEQQLVGDRRRVRELHDVLDARSATGSTPATTCRTRTPRPSRRRARGTDRRPWRTSCRCRRNW